jgi:hypothetical protein
MGVDGQRHTPAALPSRRRPGAHCVGGRVGPKTALSGAENLTVTGFRFPERPSRSE